MSVEREKRARPSVCFFPSLLAAFFSFTHTHMHANTCDAGALGVHGQLIVLGADVAPIEAPPVAIIGNCGRIQGWASGSPIDSEDTLRFAHENVSSGRCGCVEEQREEGGRE